MAIEVTQTTRLIDDLNKLPYIEGETVQFSYDGVTYRLDLSKRNAETFHKIMQKYANAGKVVRRNGTVGFDPGKGTNENFKHVREWAEKNGLPINTRGRIPRVVMEQYLEAISHGES